MLQRYVNPVIDVVMAVHGSNCGSGDPLSDEKEQESISFLRGILDDWHVSIAQTELFDGAVRQLVIACLAETETKNKRHLAFKYRELIDSVCRDGSSK
jgi:hypothetical protein